MKPRSLHDTPLHESASLAAESIGGILDRYLASLEAGTPLSVDELLTQHPEYAAVIQAPLRQLEALHRMSNGIGTSTDNKLELGASHEAPVALGDFRIVREVGRGGMGVVYEADQLSLARRVALKVLPFAAVLDPRHLQRFKNEALAAAHLDHPNIVEVYGIGCERSIHFYAMRFVDGVTLADVIAARRNDVDSSATSRIGDSNFGSDEAATATTGERAAPRVSSAETSPALQAALSTVNSAAPHKHFRYVAELGIQAAEALDHAHHMGIVHRDIKPSNLMLDERGRLWVTDFGLARNQGDASMTMTGDLLGTLRYMSPEQALAKRITVDHRTDIYSLGVTLYELLTLAPAFPGPSREETLRQIAFDEPASPHKLNRAIPRELATIVLKAMAKNPNERYAMGKEFADDLRCFLDARPIKAKPPGPLRRAMKWSQRHRSLTRVAAGIFVCAAFSSFLAAFFISRAYQARSEEKARALATLDAALNAMDELTVWTDSVLVGHQHRERLTREFEEKIVDLYRQLDLEHANDGRILGRAVDAYIRMGNAFSSLRRDAEAETACRKALQIAERYAELQPKDDNARLVVAGATSQLAAALHLQQKYAESEDLFAKAAAIEEPIMLARPDHIALQRRYLWMTVENRLMNFAHLNRLPDEERLARKAVSIATSLAERNGNTFADASHLPISINLLRETLTRREKLEEAKQLSFDQHRWCDAFLEQYPAEPTAPHVVASVYHSYAVWISNSLKEPELALPWFERSLAFERKAVPVDEAYAFVTLGNIARTHMTASRWNACSQCTREQFDLIRSIVVAHPDVPGYREEAVGAAARLLYVMEKQGSTLEERLPIFVDAARHQVRLIVDYPDHAPSIAMFVEFLNRGEPFVLGPGPVQTEYASFLKETVSDFKASLSALPNNARVRNAYAFTLCNYARSLRLRGRTDEAILYIGEARKLMLPFAAQLKATASPEELLVNQTDQLLYNVGMEALMGKDSRLAVDSILAAPRAEELLIRHDAPLSDTHAFFDALQGQYCAGQFRDEISRLWNQCKSRCELLETAAPSHVAMCSGMLWDAIGECAIADRQWDKAVDAKLRAADYYAAFVAQSADLRVKDPVAFRDSLRLLYNTGWTLTNKLERGEAAIKAFEAVVAADPDAKVVPQAHWILCELYCNPKLPSYNLGRAAEVLASVSEMHYGGMERFFALGVLQLRRGQLQLAIDDLERSLEETRARSAESAGNANLICLEYFYLAIAHAQLGQASDARSALSHGEAWLTEFRELHPVYCPSAYLQLADEARQCVAGLNTLSASSEPDR